jgi:hypothetical protein
MVMMGQSTQEGNELRMLGAQPMKASFRNVHNHSDSSLAGIKHFRCFRNLSNSHRKEGPWIFTEAESNEIR